MAPANLPQDVEGLSQVLAPYAPLPDLKHALHATKSCFCIATTPAIQLCPAQAPTQTLPTLPCQEAMAAALKSSAKHGCESTSSSHAEHPSIS